MLTRLRRDETGVALIVALLVVFVIAMLAVTVLQLSIHNVQQSAYDRKRVQSVNASEAGVDDVWSKIQQTSPELLPWDPTTHTGPFSGTLGTGPGTASFDATVTYYDASQTQMTTQPSQSNPPAYALISSQGTTNGTVTRTVQSYVKLTPIRQAIQSAVTINSSAAFSNNFTINGQSGDDGDVHIETGDLTIQNQPNIYGSVYVSNGKLSTKNNNTIHGDAWAWSTVDIQNPAAVLGYARSSQAEIKGSGTIGGDATAGTAIASSLSVAGSEYANSPTTTHPPSVSFPLVCWTSSGSCVGQSNTWATYDVRDPLGTPDYTIVTFAQSGTEACTAARAYLLAGASNLTGDTVVRISPSTCKLNIGLNDVIPFSGNLAIFTDGGIDMATQNTWEGQSGNSLMFISNYRAGLDCSTGAYDIATGNYSNFNNVSVSFYSPCSIYIRNLNSFSGQIIGNSVNLQGNFTLNYQPVLIPGVGSIIGFQQDVVYIREVTG